MKKEGKQLKQAAFNEVQIMKSKFLVDMLFVVFIAMITTVITFEFYIKDSIRSEMPKVAIISMDSEIEKLGIDLSPADYKAIALQLKTKSDELASQGYIVIDNASVISASDNYKVN